MVFESQATNLVPRDTSNTHDIFVHNRLTRETTRVSLAYDGAQARRDSTYPTLSADGRYVAFTALATNLISPLT